MFANFNVIFSFYCFNRRFFIALMFRYAVVLAFDVKVERDAQDLADKEGIKIFTADIIYHLFDKFTAYTEVRFGIFVRWKYSPSG